MRLTSKVVVNVRNPALAALVRSEAEAHHIWVREAGDDSAVPDVCVVITDHEWAGVKSNAVWAVYPSDGGEDSGIMAAAKAGYRNFLVFRDGMKPCDMLPYLFLRDASRSPKRRTDRDCTLVDDFASYENREFRFNFGEGKVVRKASGAELYFTRAQIYWLYRRMVKRDLSWNRSQGTRLTGKYGRELLFPLIKYAEEEEL